ncbi:hypothetical protein D3797_017530 [Bacillus subtilis]|nr:hypothetical protein D3797_017530 [Bacillus subtilis]
MRDYYILLGNGFTIDFLRHLNINEDTINVSNLFSHGDRVPYPMDKEPGFLSFKRCPHLWSLGARPYMNDSAAIALIEDIITCANIASSAKARHLSSEYIRAYQELTSYLKYLFVYFNDKISDHKISEELQGWGWLELLKKLSTSENCRKITIVTLNYDIWLERILINHNINFEVAGFVNGVYNNQSPAKIKIIKPHGSISFAFKESIEPARFQISTSSRDLTNGKLADYRIINEDLNNIYMVNALIPPAGDSGRLTTTDNWAAELRKLAIESARELKYSDEVLISGISYWHVDRLEIDDILTNIHSDVNVKLINPYPSSTLSAVLTSLFEKNVIYRSSSILGDLYND